MEGITQMARITPIKAAELLGRTPQCVRNWIQSGYLPSIKIGGRYFVEEKHVQSIMEGKKPHNAELGI